MSHNEMPFARMSRRRAMGGMVAMAAAATAPLGARRAMAASGDALNIYSWPDYFAPDNLNGFAAKSGVTPTISTFESNETLFAKLNSPAGRGFDIAIPTQSWIKQMTERKLLQKLDHSRINLDALNPELLNRDYDPGNQYSIPKDYGFTGLVYDPEVCGMEIKTWDDFFTAGAKGASGKVRMSGSGQENIALVLWLEGIDPNSATRAQIEKASKRLIEFAPHVRAFSGQNADPLVNGELAMSFEDQGMARTAMLQNPKLKWVLPEPFSELWVDSYTIVAGSAHTDLAYDFINWQLEPEHELVSTEYIGYPAAVKGLEDKINPETKAIDMIFGGKDVDFSKLYSFVVNPDTIGAFMQAQSQIVAAAG